MVVIGDLGMIRGVRRDGDAVVIAFSPTYSGCPATDPIQQDILQALTAAGYDNARVEIQASPAWSTDWITERGREKLRAAGIAPPVAVSTNAALPLFGERKVPCPLCGSTDTERLAEHGSTPCKALYRCSSCWEPFDHFKCH